MKVMEKAFEDIARSGLYIFVIGLLLWPPMAGHRFWYQISDVLGGSDPLRFTMVGLSCLFLGGIFGLLTEIEVFHFATGGVLAYFIGISIVTVMVFPPEIPLYLFWYGGMLICFISGTVIWRSIQYIEKKFK